jgi:hypothetical protein
MQYNEDEFLKLQLLLNNMNIDQNSYENVPLLKNKNKTAIISNVEANPVPDLLETFKPVKVKKPRPPKTLKQMEAFKKVAEKRNINIEMKKKERMLSSAKLLFENYNKKHEQPPAQVMHTQKKAVVCESSDEEIYVVQSKPKKNKIRKRIIIESSSEDSDSDSDNDERVQINRQSYVDTNNFFV